MQDERHRKGALPMPVPMRPCPCPCLCPKLPLSPRLPLRLSPSAKLHTLVQVGKQTELAGGKISARIGDSSRTIRSPSERLRASSQWPSISIFRTQAPTKGARARSRKLTAQGSACCALRVSAASNAPAALIAESVEAVSSSAARAIAERSAPACRRVQPRRKLTQRPQRAGVSIPVKHASLV